MCCFPALLRLRDGVPVFDDQPRGVRDVIFQQTHCKIAIAFERSVDDSLMLERNRFARIGLSPRYLKIAGEWRDHILFARTVED